MTGDTGLSRRVLFGKKVAYLGNRHGEAAWRRTGWIASPRIVGYSGWSHLPPPVITQTDIFGIETSNYDRGWTCSPAREKVDKRYGGVLNIEGRRNTNS